MPVQTFDQALILLAASVLVVALARRAGLPVILGYLLVGAVLGPSALDVVPNAAQTHEMAAIGVVFLLFTLGLEVSFPRMVAMRREVLGLGAVQTLVVGGAGAVAAGLYGMDAVGAIAVGGALAMCSTAIVLQQLGDQDELGRTHGRLAFAVLLFQDLAFVPLLALATAHANGGTTFGPLFVLRLVGLGVAALVAVLALGRWVLRPLLHVIAHSQLRELFTLTALLIVLASAWVTQWLGLSMALGAFLAGLLFAETEFRYQIEAAIRPFRELLLGLFFVSVGLLLDVRVLFAHWLAILAALAALTVGKLLLSAVAIRSFGFNRFKAVRTGVVLAGGGEFGVALLTVLAPVNGAAAPWLQPVLAALVLSMIVSPVMIRYNRRIARALLGERGPPAAPVFDPGQVAPDIAAREHVIVCGFGRVGIQLTRVLVSQGFEFVAADRDPDKVRDARLAGEPVVYGDCTDEDLLRQLGLERTTVVVVTFADPAVALGIVRAVRRLRLDVPVLVRTQDDSRLAELRAAGATEVVPETFEASLTLVAQALRLLQVPAAQVAQIAAGMRGDRYDTLRVASVETTPSGPAVEADRAVVISPGAWAQGRSLADVRARGAAVVFTAIRRQGITGRDPDAQAQLRAGDTVVFSGSAEALEHAEKILLAG